MKRKNTIWSLVLALVMVLGVIAPVATLAAQPGNDDSKPSEATETKTVTLHKLMMTKDELKAWSSKEIEEKGYDGSQDLDALKKFLGTRHSAKEAQGVYFVWQDKKKLKDDDGNDLYVAAKYTNQEKKEGKLNEPYFKNVGPKEKPVWELQYTPNIDEALGDKTGANGIEFKTSNLQGGFLKGEFIIQEIKEKSTYKNDGNVIVDQKAVPVEITLPLVNNKGIVEKAHVYPKNTESKPVIDKNFRKPNADPEKGDLVDKMEGVDLTKEEEDNLKKYDNDTIDLGAKYENYGEAKAKAKAYVGKSIPYEVKTKIEAGTSYERLIWNDTMTNGLTFNKDVKVLVESVVPGSEDKKDRAPIEMIDEKRAAEKNKNITEESKKIKPDYLLVQDDNGFRLQMTDSGLKKISNVTLAETGAKDVEITLTYSATVNGTAVVDNPEKNNVTLEYGHQKGKNLEKKPVKPSGGELTVNKIFQKYDPKTKEWKTIKTDGESLTSTDLEKLEIVYTLKKDGEVKASVRLDKDTKKGTTIDLGNGITFKVDETNFFKGTFKGLGNEAEGWTISERVAGYNPEYAETNADGTVTITNKKDDDNPTPLKPETPEVVVGGKKFVKTSEDKDGTKNFDRLAGAKFVVKKGKDQYLTVKSVDTVEKEKEKLANAKLALKTAVEKYNNRKEGEDEAPLKTAINKAQKDYNDAFKAAGIRYEWKSEADAKTGDNFKDDVVTLTSDGIGQFEITGLEYGDYELEEIQPPKGYAKIPNVKFKVEKNSYKTEENGIDYKLLDAKGNVLLDEDKKEKIDGQGKRVINKLVTIPQTGGMGTVLFMVVGVALMGGAFIAMKKRSAEQA